MKKIAVLSVLAVLPLCACNKTAEKTSFDVISAAIEQNADKVIETSDASKCYSVPASKEILAIYAQEKDSQFIVADAAKQNTEGNCVVNVISETEYRVFCGSAEDVVADKAWAVSVVKPAEVAAAVEEAAVATEEKAAVAEEKAEAAAK